MHTTTDHVNEGRDQTADMLNLRPKRLPTLYRRWADKFNARSDLIHYVNLHGRPCLIAEYGTWFREMSMKTQAYTQVIEPPASLMGTVPVAKSLDASLLEIMFNLLGGRDGWRRLPILRLLTSRSPAGYTALLPHQQL